jgi:hypothetical protein
MDSFQLFLQQENMRIHQDTVQRFVQQQSHDQLQCARCNGGQDVSEKLNSLGETFNQEFDRINREIDVAAAPSAVPTAFDIEYAAMCKRIKEFDIFDFSDKEL